MIDKIDWQILRLLQKDGRIAYSEIARQVNLSPPAVAERIRKLEAAEVITGYHAAVNLERLGYPIVCFVHLTVSAKIEPHFIDFIQDKPQVRECYLTAGENTFILKIAVPSIRHLNTFLDELVTYGHCTTFVVLSEILSRKVIDR